MDTQQFYERLQTELLAWIEHIPAVRVILVVGSQARQIKPADEYSDLDLSLYVTGGDEHESETYLQWMEDFAPIWMILEEHHDETKSWLILYQGGIKVDFSITPVDALQTLIDAKTLWDDQQRGYKILLDKDGIAAQLPTPTPFAPPPYTPPTQTQFIQRVEGYFYGLVYVAKQIRRGNLWKIKWADQIQQTMLLEMLEWHAHATHDSPVDTYYRGDFMRDWVSAATWRELHEAFAHFEAADSRKSLIASVHLFTRLTEETAAKWGYEYPRRMVDEVTDYISGLGAP
ncbi:MAG: aminoglycoside 6-adenylyltransferase [Anaerolineaceae bacterium]|nr:aminoglycoside 6-adenylyltransferase [Anaerolineaceae bacterium]